MESNLGKLLADDFNGEVIAALRETCREAIRAQNKYPGTISVKDLAKFERLEQALNPFCDYLGY